MDPDDESSADLAAAAGEPGADGEAEDKESLFQRLKGKAREVQSTVAEKIAETTEAAQEKLREKLDELDGLLPAIRELGYTVEAVEIGIGLLPEIGIDVSGLARTMDAATYERVLEEQKENKVISLVLRTLQTTSTWQQKIHFAALGCDQATITLGLPPRITLKFTRESREA